MQAPKNSLTPLEKFVFPEESTPEWSRTRALWEGVRRFHDGQDYKSNLEDLLKSLLPESAQEHLMIGQEGRGAFLLMLGLARGKALFLGDALSGTISALAGSGFHVTVCDYDRARLAFGAARDEALAPKRVQHIQVAPGGPFPFRKGMFDLVVAELGPRGEAPLWKDNIQAAIDLTHDSFVWITDNALAYKRALGRRSHFEYTRPWQWARSAWNPGPGEDTRKHYIKTLSPHFGALRSMALYPHRLECSHVVSLDRPGPELTVGPKEKRNLVKVLAKRAGAFPVLAPSYAWIGRRWTVHEEPRLQRILDGLSERLNTERHSAEHLIATRGNVAVVQTKPADPHAQAWTLHIPLCAQKRRLLRRHFQCLKLLPKRAPRLPVPKAIWQGEIEGLWLTCEARLPGHNSPQLQSGGPQQAHMFRRLAQALVDLAEPVSVELTDELFDVWIRDRAQKVVELCGRRCTSKHIDAMVYQARELMVGEIIRPALYHADLRPKHVQARPDGSLIGIMDWGAFEECFLPYVDLIHTFVHLRHDAARIQWLRLVRGEIEDWERESLQGYANQLDLSEEFTRGVEALYPVLIAGMAERNWDFSRPYWVHQEYGI